MTLWAAAFSDQVFDYREILLNNNPILIRGDLEPGNVLDLHGERLTHTWERMFSWIAINDGYRVNGI